MSDKLTLAEEVAAWEHSRNKKHVKADWHFTTADARVKLKRLYPAGVHSLRGLFRAHPNTLRADDGAVNAAWARSRKSPDRAVAPMARPRD